MTRHSRIQNSSSILKLKRYFNKYLILFITILILIISFCLNMYLKTIDNHNLRYPLSNKNLDKFDKISSASPMSSINEFQYKSSDIYGPLESQPADLFEPFNSNSLIFVLSLFTVSFLMFV